MPNTTNGPRLRLDVSCFECEHRIYESDKCQGDSGHDHYCNQPGVKMDNAKGGFGPRYIGTTCKTPQWCPYYPSHVAMLVERQNKGL